MSNKLIIEIISLIQNGWRPYNGAVLSTVYENLKCDIIKKKPAWFILSDVFQCIGCSSRCTLFRPEGFQKLLYPQYTVKKGITYSLTPEEMVNRKNTLTVGEAAYCLNVSPRTIYRLVYEAKLVALKEKPIRIRTKEVKEMMNDFDE